MPSEKRNLLLAALLLAAASALFMTLNARGMWDFVLPLRAAKLLAILLVAYAIGVSTLLFQTLTHNPILTPSLLGFDTLYVFLQTMLPAVRAAPIRRRLRRRHPPAHTSYAPAGCRRGRCRPRR